jgi:hypothetical protein
MSKKNLKDLIPDKPVLHTATFRFETAVLGMLDQLAEDLTTSRTKVLHALIKREFDENYE